jgi:hypothetical protein
MFNRHKKADSHTEIKHIKYIPEYRLKQKPMDNINAGWSGEPPNKSFHKQCPECPERQQHNLLQKQKSREIEHWSLQNLRTPSRSSEEGDMETLKYHIFWSTMYL